MLDQTKKRTPSPQQQAIIDFPVTGRGSAFGEAVAGAGKTTTALWAVANMNGSVAVMAFNKSASLEFTKKAAELGLNLGNRVRFGTCHSFGLSGWRYVHKNVRIEADGKRDIVARKLGLDKEGTPEYALRGFVPRLISLAKQGALGLFGSIDDASEWYQIVDHHDMAYELEDEAMLPRGIELAIQGIKLHRDMASDVIDFDDMIYMPVVSGIRLYQNDWVVGDEWQDANRARRALARKLLKPNGRALFIGDRRQAIYGFTGADNDSIAHTIKDFNCTELPLTVTYRCPKAVVAKAREIVDHIEAHDSAPEGSVSQIELEDLFKLAQPDEAMRHLQPTDAILCRKTRPLVDVAFSLIRMGVACHVEGRDIGAGLIKLLDRFKSARSVHSLIDRLNAYGEQHAQKLTAKGKEAQAQALLDRVATVVCIAEKCKDFDDVKARIQSMFEDSEKQTKPTLTLSTVHKAKGREWPRVFILGANLWMPGPWARQAWEKEQEENLQYVAYTRAQRELVFVNATPE